MSDYVTRERQEEMCNWLRVIHRDHKLAMGIQGWTLIGVWSLNAMMAGLLYKLFWT